jgi:hypothetical protein
MLLVCRAPKLRRPAAIYNVGIQTRQRPKPASNQQRIQVCRLLTSSVCRPRFRALKVLELSNGCPYATEYWLIAFKLSLRRALSFAH